MATKKTDLTKITLNDNYLYISHLDEGLQF